jgi:DnaJ-class molecular chaperone
MGSDQFKARIDQIYRDLERYSYYELLNLSPQATPDEIRAAFHRMALSVHPDRFQQHEDQELRKKIYTIYKRMTEGYRVLTEPKDRRAYNEGLDQGLVRLVRTKRKVASYKRTEDAIDHPKAKKFFEMAQDAERRGDIKNAKINYKFALDMAPDHPVITQAKQRLEQQEQEQEQEQEQDQNQE